MGALHADEKGRDNLVPGMLLAMAIETQQDMVGHEKGRWRDIREGGGWMAHLAQQQRLRPREDEANAERKEW